MLRNTIDLGHQERGLMDVEAVILLVRIDDGPFLGISELHRAAALCAGLEGRDDVAIIGLLRRYKEMIFVRVSCDISR